MRRMRAGRWSTMVAFLAVLVGSSRTEGQDLASYDYENLYPRAFGVELAVLDPSRLESTIAYGVRMDLGFLGPGVRVSPFLSFWRADFQSDEVGELEARLEELVQRNDPDFASEIDLGRLEWSDLVLGADVQYVWTTAGPIAPFLGLGFSAHVMNGEGTAIVDTFIEDLLDRVSAGINGHLGLEYQANDRFRLVGQLRYELMDDLRYPELRLGALVLTGLGGGGAS